MGFADELKNKAHELVEDVRDKIEGKPEEPVEDFAAAGPPPEVAEENVDYVDEEADELNRHSQPGNL